VKRCLHCDEAKPLTEFYVDRGARGGRRPECRSCTAARRKAWYEANRQREVDRVRAWQEANPERYAERQREYRESGRKAIANRKSHLKRKYGLTVEQYEAMLDAQGGVCFICRETPGDLPLHVDHDHTTGDVRGLLCIRCNNALGLFQESPALFQAAADYLRARDHDAMAGPK
jgi:Autographiviridae endonuclease VII